MIFGQVKNDAFKTASLMRRFITGAVIAALVVAAVLTSRKKSWTISLRVPSYRQLGPLFSPVTITLFSDFQCPNCAVAAPVVKSLFENHNGKIRLIFRQHPLSMHQWAVQAAMAAECAGIQGKFWEYHDLLYAKQEEWAESKDAPPLFYKYAKDLGLDVARFEKDMNGAEVIDLLEKDQEEGKALNVDATPTVFINERRLVGATQIKQWGVRYVTLESGEK